MDPEHKGQFRQTRERLAEMYPDSRFVHIVRNPFEVAPSLLSLLATTWRQLGFPEKDVRAGCGAIHQKNMQAYEIAFQMFDRLDPGRYIILDYREIAAAPKATMRWVGSGRGPPIEILQRSSSSKDPSSSKDTPSSKYQDGNGSALGMPNLWTVD